MTATPFRAPAPAHPDSWDMEANARLAHSAVAGTVLARLADNDKRITVLTADLKFSNRTSDFETRHPDRFFNVGIAEQHMVTMAAGMASCGLIPYVATFASFVGLLCAEQIRTDLAYPGLPVRVLAHHAGISLGYYGTSHHATEDISMMRAIANLTVISPADAPSITALLAQTVELPGPVYFRLGRGREPDVYPEGSGPVVGELSELLSGPDLLVVTTGTCLKPTYDAAIALRQEAVNVTVLDAHTLRPFNSKQFAEIAARFSDVLVVEEHNTYGGLASICADALVDAGLGNVRIIRHGMPADDYALIGAPFRLYQHYGLDASGVQRVIREALGVASESGSRGGRYV